MTVASLFEDLLDQYKIEQHIAKKRYTDLYQAYDVDDDRQVRLEILRAEYAGDSSFVGRFINRARALAQVRHSNILPVFHIGKAAGGVPYVAQAAVDGYPLSHRLEQLAQRKTPVNPIYALKLVRQVAEALTLAERLELFHYDLQPDNIILKNVTLPVDDSVVLVDLFIPAERATRGVAASEDLTAQVYLSPEQRAGKEMSGSSHIYSLGAILYRLMAGDVPDGPVTRLDANLRRVFGRPTALERERGDLSHATYNLIDRCLSKEPSRRYTSAESFIVALDQALTAEESRLRSESGRSTIIDRRPLAWLLPLLIVALFLAVGAVATRSLVIRDDELGEATPPATSVSGSIADAPTRNSVGTGGGTTDEPPPTDEPLPTPTLAGGLATREGETATSTRPADTPTPKPSATPTAPAETPALPPTTQTPIVRVMHNLVNLRRGPGVVYPLFGTVTGGELLEVLAWNDDEDNPWYLVQTDDQRIGWIAATVIQAEATDALAAVPVAATLPATPIPTMTPTATPTIAIVITVQLTTESGEPGDGGATRPPVRPTDAPTEPPVEPTRTPPPFTPGP